MGNTNISLCTCSAVLASKADAADFQRMLSRVKSCPHWIDLDAQGYDIFYIYGGFELTDKPNLDNHVETDGKGGLRIVITEDMSWILNNPAIISSISMHEATHIDDAMAVGPNMAKGMPAGLNLAYSTVPAQKAAELHATSRQLTYLDAILGLPANQTYLDSTQMAQVKWYRYNAVQRFRDKVLGLSLPKMSPVPAAWFK